MPQASVPGLFPAIEPFSTGWLAPDRGHRVYFEQCGNPDGIPVLFLHGGPASGCSPRHRQFFDPSRYRVILFDQRGSGRSEPYGHIADNTSADLIRDIARLREQLGIEQWLVFGGSWGASLALAAAADAPDTVSGLVLRGVFLTGAADMQWFFQDAGMLMPDAWHRFAGQVDAIDTDAGQGMQILAAYTKALQTDRAAAATAAWIHWENSLTRPGGQPAGTKPGQSDSGADAKTIAKYQLQAAYLNRLCDLGEPAMIAAADRLVDKPVAIVHGRLDWVCRPGNAWKIHRRMRTSCLRLIDHAGHDPFHADMVGALIDATNSFARDYHFDSLREHWHRFSPDTQ